MAAIVGDTLTMKVAIATEAVAALLVPPGPVQVSEYDVFAVSAAVLWLPLVGNAPLQPPEAAHAVALVELQVSVEVPPLAIVVGFASNVAVATGGAVTATMTVAAWLTPPGPVQVSEYDVFVVSAPVLRLPLVRNAPLQPPEAVHAVALVELQVSVEVPPLAVVVGFASNAAVGTGGAVTATMTVAAGLTPPGPVQVSEYDVFVVSAPVLRLPLVGNAPLQPPEAVHAVAFVELQVNVDASPLPIGVRDALMDAPGRASIGDLLTSPPQATNSAVPIAMTGVEYRITLPVFFDRMPLIAHTLV
jgi:hypothetical protein